MSFSVIDHGNENARSFDSRGTADDKAKGVKQMVSDPSAIEVVQGDYENYKAYQNRDTDAEDNTAEVVETPTQTTDGGHVQPEPTTAADKLPDRDLTDDPFEWMPGHYVDQIDGSPAINRQGYAVLSQFYDINVTSDVVVGPEDTDFTFCRCEATAWDADGQEYRAHGSAHVDRGDDSTLLLEMADTRATKRVLALATGVGAVAVEELKNSL